jgi:FXSXX-COOH protein
MNQDTVASEVPDLTGWNDELPEAAVMRLVERLVPGQDRAGVTVAAFNSSL